MQLPRQKIALALLAAGTYVVHGDGSLYTTKIKGSRNKIGPLVTCKPFCNRAGHSYIDLRWEGQKFRVAIHQLVWLQYRGPIPVGLEINHIDGIKTNNNITNLELVTRSGNAKHAASMGLWHPPSLAGEQHGRAVLTVENVREIRATASHRFRVSRLAKKFGVHTTTIRSVLKGINWRDV